jgi:phosphopantetheinyl transferase
MQPVFASKNLLTDVSVAIVEVVETASLNKAAAQSQAARLAANLAAGKELQISKNELGKPLVENVALNVSLSHSKFWAAAAISPKMIVGIDVETLEERIQRVAHKFLLPSELESIQNNRIETLSLYWSAKESLYKLYSFKQIDFAEQLRIEPFELQREGLLTASIIVAEQSLHALKVAYKFFDNHVLTLVSAAPQLFNR